MNRDKPRTFTIWDKLDGTITLPDVKPDDLIFAVDPKTGQTFKVKITKTPYKDEGQ